MPAASTSPTTSGCSVSLSAITSSLIQEVANSSRASFAVVTASRTLRHPAVLGSTVTSSSRISDQNASPVLPPAASRRSDTVTISAPEARIPPRLIAGGGEGRAADQQAGGEGFAVEVQHGISVLACREPLPSS